MKAYAIVDSLDGSIVKATTGSFTNTYEYVICPTREEADLQLDELLDCGDRTNLRVQEVEIKF